MKTVAYVTIKLNSERVPQKNIRTLGSRPLCYHIVDTLLKVKNVDEVYVYCSDEEVKKYLPEQAIFLQRDKKFDGNEVKAKEIYDAFINTIDADIYVAACTTSPFTKIETIENAIEKIKSEDYDSAFTVRREQTFAWYQGRPLNYSRKDVPRTQDIEPVMIETSAFFAFRKAVWTGLGQRIGNKPYMQEVDAIEAIDIDTMDDFIFASAVAEHIRKI